MDFETISNSYPVTSALHTTDPVALRYLMSETLFSVAGEAVDAPVDEPRVVADESVAQPAVAVPEPETEATPATSQPAEFAFLGENKRGYLFVTDDPQSDYLSGPAMDAFVKTLGARQLGLADVAVFNAARHAGPVAFADLAAFFKPRAVVLLGPPASRFGLPEVLPNTVGSVGGTPVFQTYSFDVLLVDAEKKGAFWPVLKSLLV